MVLLDSDDELLGTISLVRSRMRLEKLRKSRQGTHRFVGMREVVVDRSLLVQQYQTDRECMAHHQSCGHLYQQFVREHHNDKFCFAKIGSNLHNRDGVIVKDCRDIFGRKLVGCVGDK